jgi:hypothetical protein
VNNLLPCLLLVFLTEGPVLAKSPIEKAENQWPMASGPMGTWTTTTNHSIPTEWSVSTGSNVLWKTVLPEGGQSDIAVWEDRLFLTINKPLPEGTPLEKAEGSDIIAYCLDTNTGKVLWTRDIPSNGTNSRGMRTANDQRSERDGWGHVTAGSPIAVNDYVFFSTMIGMTYVVDSQAPLFDETALVAINDLGPATESWRLSTVSYANGRIFHRDLKQIVCIVTTD